MSDDSECIEIECPTCGALCVQGPGEEDYDALSTQPCEELDRHRADAERLRAALLEVEHIRTKSCNYCCAIAPNHLERCAVGKALNGDGSGPDRGFEIEMEEGAVELDVKRFCFPAVLRTKCPKCGADHERDFDSHHLSYPVANEAFDADLYCPEEGCGHEWTVRLRLVLRLEGA